MTISTTVSRVSYNGNGVTTAFATTFRFFEAGDLVVQLVKADDTVVMQTITTDYTVTGADDDAGGTVTMIVPPASGERLVIQRVLDAVQETDYAPGDPFPAESHERALDRLTMLVQQNEDEISRSFRLDPTSLATAELPAAEAGKFLGWSEDGLSIVNLDSTGTGAGEIGTASLADGAVTTVKLADEAVTLDKLDSTLTLPIGQGGTGQTTAAAAFNAIKQAASTTDAGVVELATAAEAPDRTKTAVVLTPATLRDALAAQNDAPIYAVRAWVNINASSGTPAIRASGNVASITDNGVGDFTVNLTTAMPDADYVVGHTVKALNNNARDGLFVKVYDKTTTSFRVLVHSVTPTANDPEILDLFVVR